MNENEFKELQRRFREAVPARRADLARLLEEAQQAGNAKAVREYSGLLKKLDKSIAEYGLDRNA